MAEPEKKEDTIEEKQDLYYQRRFKDADIFHHDYTALHLDVLSDVLSHMRETYGDGNIDLTKDPDHQKEFIEAIISSYKSKLGEKVYDKHFGDFAKKEAPPGSETEEQMLNDSGVPIYDHIKTSVEQAGDEILTEKGFISMIQGYKQRREMYGMPVREDQMKDSAFEIIKEEDKEGHLDTLLDDEGKKKVRPDLVTQDDLMELLVLRYRKWEQGNEAGIYSKDTKPSDVKIGFNEIAHKHYVKKEDKDYKRFDPRKYIHRAS